MYINQTKGIMHNIITPQRVVSIAIVAIALLLLAIAGGQDAQGSNVGGGVPAAKASPRVCFDASQWGPAPDSRRPCYTVERLFEDGSGSLLIGSASQAKARCIIPNVSEETGDFTVKCSRIGGGR